ncbi:MAG: phosphate ABC transporter permease PstA [Candidatus Tectimicrobiota bacterium]
MQKAPFLAQRRRHNRGEPFVWFTAMGLAVALLMVVYLLGLVLLNGLQAFWPKRVVHIELREGTTTGFTQGRVLGGEVVKIQQRAGRSQSTRDATEWQLMVGNKETYGLAFVYLDYADMARINTPPEVIVIERLEYGDAIGLPVALTIKDAGVIPSTQPEFAPRLQALVDEATARRETIRRIERRDIGVINAKMDDLRLQQRTLARAQRPGEPLPAAAQTIQAAMQALQAEYEVLATRARELRARQEEHFLTYRLLTGEERRLALGQIVHYYFPNQLTTLQRLRVFAHNLWVFFAAEPREANTEGGVFPAIFGTFVMTLLMSLAVTPFGVLAALYLREYARQGLAVRAVRIAVNNLAGVPSIVFGVFGLGFFVYLVGGTIDQVFFAAALPTPTFGTGGILWASLTLALMTVPVVIVATEEALAAVPRGIREGSLACGASKWQTIQRIVLPAAAPGILTGLILAMARGAGEVAPLMLVGVVKLAPTLPLDTLWPFFHLDRKFMHLGFHIYDLGFQSPDSDAARPMVFATTLFLISLIVLLNIGAILLRDRLRKKYATGAF